MKMIDVGFIILGDDPGECPKGQTLSTQEKLWINKQSGGYKIYILEHDLIEGGPDLYVDGMVKQFSQAFKGVHIKLGISLGMHHQLSVNAMASILKLDDAFIELDESVCIGTNSYHYKGDVTLMNKLRARLREMLDDIVETADEDEEEVFEVIDDDGFNDIMYDGYDDYDDEPPSRSQYGYVNKGYPEFDDVPSVKGSKGSKGSKKSKKKKKWKFDGSSYCMTASKDPKKEYERHGVIVVKDKKPIRRDIEFIMKVLKRFIPGNQKWKKEFRKDLAERWIGSYVVTKKKLARLEKDYQKSLKEEKRQAKKPLFDPARALVMTETLLGSNRTDGWSDPRR